MGTRPAREEAKGDLRSRWSGIFDQLYLIVLFCSQCLASCRIQKPFVDETAVDEDVVALEKEKNHEAPKENVGVVKENVVKAIFEEVKKKNKQETEMVDLCQCDEGDVEKSRTPRYPVKKVRVDVKNIKDVQKAIEKERLERVEREA